MPLLISEVAYSMLAAYSADIGVRIADGEQLQDGRWVLKVEWVVWRRLLKIHPDPSQAIIQACESAAARGRS